jgi:signal transduction histidine kinase
MPSIFRTLRFRIAAAFFLWTGLIQVALFIGLPVARDAYMIDAVDRRLRQVGESLVTSAQEGAAPADMLATTGLRSADPSAVQVRIEDEAANVLAASAGADDVPRGTGAAHATIKVAARGKAPPERVRVAQFEAQVPQGGVRRIEVAQWLGQADGVTRAIQRVLVLGLALGLIGSAVAGWIVSGAIISRIDQVSRAVRAVAPTRLDERIDLPVGGDEIGRMAGDVNHMLERMAVAFRSQERFMSEVSHELKTPVSALLTEAQVLKHTRTSPRSPVPAPLALGNGSAHPLTADNPRAQVEPYERFVLSVEEEMRWLGKLVESFLMLARFGHGKQFVAESVVAVNDVVLDAVEHSTLYARQHGVTLALTLHDAGESGQEAVVRGDSELLRVVADNLIRNAVQFSKRGDTVTVKVAVEPGTREGGAPLVVFTVKDQGPGVPEEYLTRIFDRFAQAPGKRSTRRGSGLGLTIAKGVTDLHGGTIDARNAAEGGCVFRVRIPAQQASPQGAGGTEGSLPGS